MKWYYSNKFKILNEKGGNALPFDYSKLKGRIIEKYGTQHNFSEAMKWSERTLSLKMNGLRAWTQKDICRAVELLDISEREIPEYFFKMKVQKI